MKRQFVQMKPIPISSYQEQISPSQEWLSEQSVQNTPATSQKVTPSGNNAAPSGKGLLSSWKAKQEAVNAVVATNTVIQVAVQRPITEPIHQRASNGLLSGANTPRHSGNTPIPNMFVGQPQPAYPAPAWQAAGAQPMSLVKERPQTQAVEEPFSHTLWGTAPEHNQEWQPLQMQTPPVQSLRPPTQASPPWSQQTKRKKLAFPIWARIVVAVTLVLLILVGTGIGYYEVNFASTVSNTVGQTVKRVKGDDAPNQASSSNDILSGPRINVLLLGSDTDQKFTDASGQSHYIAQTDIVITIDPATKSVGMLSIPRDSWLTAPGYGSPMKLDEAYGYGGAALSEATIHQDFGIYINYYAWVGLDGFIKVIDTAGGVDIDAIHPITDDNYPDDVGNKTGDLYAYKRLSIAPGPQHMSGLGALEYVRSRHADLVGDFGRSVRQQQVLTQLKTKLNSPNIIGQLPALAKDLNGYVKTDMQLADVFKLMNFARTLNQNQIQHLTLGPPYSSSAQVHGKDVVILDCAKIQPLIAKMFNQGNSSTCQVGTKQGNPTTTSALATQTLPATPTTPVVSAAANANWQLASHMANSNTLSMSGGDSSLFGMRSLLDLVFTVTFESPDGMKV